MASHYNNRIAGAEDPQDLLMVDVGNAREMCKKTLSLLNYLKNEEEKLECLRSLEQAMVQCAVIEHKITENHAGALESTKEVSSEIEAAVASGSSLAAVEYFLKMYDQLMEEKLGAATDESIAEADTSVQIVRQEIQAQVDLEEAETKSVVSEDEDIMATEEVVTNFVDPISKRPMKDPVRNTVCKHVYEKSSIMEMLKQKKRKGFRCPTMGCANRDPIKPSNLVEAPDVLRLILQSRNT